MIASLIAFTVLSPIGGLPKTLPTSTGKDLSISTADKPILVIAMTADCPHTKKAIPLLNKLAAKLKGKVSVIGLLHKDAAFVKVLSHKLGAKFPLVADSNSSLITLIGASHSLDLSWVEKGQAAKSTDGMSRSKIVSFLDSSSDKSLKALAPDCDVIGTANESGCSLD